MLVDAEVTGALGPKPGQGVALVTPQPFGICPVGTPGDGPWLDRSGLAPEHLIDLNAVAHTPAGTFAAQRLFRRAPESVYGVEAIGGSVVRVRDAVITTPNPPAWSSHGYRSLAYDDGWLYVVDCFGTPVDLLEDCGLMRAPVEQADRPEAFLWLQRGGGYASDDSARQVVFRAGPQHDLAYHPGLGQWLMSSVAGFGDTIFVRTADHPGGPYSAPRDVHRCNLPQDDPGAFCDTVRLVPALLEPELPRQAVLTYRIGSTSEDADARIRAQPSEYASMMVWVDL